MSYRLGAPKRLTVGGIAFHVATPAGTFNEWKRASRKVVQHAQTLGTLATALSQLAGAADAATGEEKSPAMVAALEKATDLSERLVTTLEDMTKAEDDLFDQALKFVVGWEDVEDTAGNPVLFSQEGLLQVDAAILEDLYLRVGEQAEQVQVAVQAGN